MIEIKIPGYQTLRLKNLLLDFNGTLAVDGHLIGGVTEQIQTLSSQLKIYIITADTFSTVEEQINNWPVELIRLSSENQAHQKLEFIQKIGAEKTVAIGNGRNDREMLKVAGLGVLTIQKEGAAVEALNSAALVVNNIHDALELLLNPLRLIASLRS